MTRDDSSRSQDTENGHGRGSGRGRGGRRRHTSAPPLTAEQEKLIAAWFTGRIPESWFEGPVRLEIDSEEIQVVGTLPSPKLAAGASQDEIRVAEQARVSGYREETRGARMRIADEAQPAFERTVSWGAECGGSRVLFTTAGVPVMTRLRLSERRILDTLIDAGVARSRSEALAWTVRLVAEHEGEWIQELRDAMTSVEEVRSRGPRTASPE